MLRHAVQGPTSLALQDDEASFTYQQLAERAAQTASGLSAFGAGDRVALNVPNSAEFVSLARGCPWPYRRSISTGLTGWSCPRWWPAARCSSPAAKTFCSRGV